MNITITKGPGSFQRQKTDNRETIDNPAYAAIKDAPAKIPNPSYTPDNGQPMEIANPDYMSVPAQIPNPDYGKKLDEMEDVSYSENEWYITDGESQYVVDNWKIVNNEQTLLKNNP